MTNPNPDQGLSTSETSWPEERTPVKVLQQAVSTQTVGAPPPPPPPPTVGLQGASQARTSQQPDQVC